MFSQHRSKKYLTIHPPQSMQTSRQATQTPPSPNSEVSPTTPNLCALAWRTVPYRRTFNLTYTTPPSPHTLDLDLLSLPFPDTQHQYQFQTKQTEFQTFITRPQITPSTLNQQKKPGQQVRTYHYTTQCNTGEPGPSASGLGRPAGVPNDRVSKG